MLQEAMPENARSVTTWDSENRDRPLYFNSKRWIDATLAVLLLIGLSPLMLLIALLIKLDTPGPVIFTQQRVGAKRRSRGGQMSWEIQNFTMYKFRSMIHNADNSTHQAYIEAWIEGRAEAANGAKAKYKLTNDPRITRVGKVLRKTSMDELPQLINVLKGNMSLVGPRPVPPYEVDRYEAWHYERLAALPGITGIWQVEGRCEVPFEDQILMDIRYVRNQSLWLDIQLLMLTLPAVLSGRGAE